MAPLPSFYPDSENRTALNQLFFGTKFREPFRIRFRRTAWLYIFQKSRKQKKQRDLHHASCPTRSELLIAYATGEINTAYET